MPEFKELSTEEVEQMRSHPDVVLVDVRDANAYETAHIPQAIALSDKNIKEFIQNTDKKKPIICYCYHGISSQSAARYLLQQGFENVYSMRGGFEAWHLIYPEKAV